LTQRVIVVGGGPAGLLAAGRAAERGAQVLLVEKMPRLGIKLRMTGHGHGNITHAGDADHIVQHLGPNGPFMRPALNRFGPRELIAFFQTRDVPSVVEPDGRVLPASRNAHNLVTSLRAYCLEHGVTFRYRSQVDCIHTSKNGVPGVCGVQVGATMIQATAVVLATGGLSYPATGSTGDGYEMARRLGHTVVQPRAGLVAMVAADAWIPEVTGLSLTDAALHAYQEGRDLATRRGDLLFTRDGISGPASLNLSLDIAEAFERGSVRLRIDLLPDTPSETLDHDLQREMREHGSATCRSLLRRRAPRSLVPVLERLAGIPGERRLAQVSAAERGRIVSCFKGLELRLVATRPIAEAMVTLGGVACDEVDPQTMRSRLVPGLYLAGELLDVTGETGGYNLQAAFTSGWIAGRDAAREA
jgi:predicted Rossmann fold flavoprotein